MKPEGRKRAEEHEEIVDMSNQHKILLVGCGKMGAAMLRGWLAKGARPIDICVIEPQSEAVAGLQSDTAITVLSSPDDLGADYVPNIVVFAVKPQGMGDIVAAYCGALTSTAVVLSIAAGLNIAFFEEILGDDVAIVRTMPNTPAAVGRGITAACANKNVSSLQRAACQNLLEAIGDVVWVDDEGLIDPITAVSGSGPAYVFHMIECLAKAGAAQGLPLKIAEELALATVAGAGELARLSSDDAETLRVNVTSPGGTTAAALDVLMSEDGLGVLMERAVEAATRRSRELRFNRLS